MKNFRELKIWKLAMDLALQVYGLAKNLPVEERFGLRSQICRAAVSIPSNIAEGCSRGSQKDLLRYVEISLGSAFELETQLLVVKELQFANNDHTIVMLKSLDELQKMLNGFRKKLVADNAR